MKNLIKYKKMYEMIFETYYISLRDTLNNIVVGKHNNEEMEAQLVELRLNVSKLKIDKELKEKYLEIADLVFLYNYSDEMFNKVISVFNHFTNIITILNYIGNLKEEEFDENIRKILNKKYDEVSSLAFINN